MLSAAGIHFRLPFWLVSVFSVFRVLANEHLIFLSGLLGLLRRKSGEKENEN
jgi:hypothetical protein